MEKHYVCDECGAQSKNPGICQNDLCIKQGVVLKECHCKDGKHGMVMGSKEDAGNVSRDSDSGTEDEGEKSEGTRPHSEEIFDADAPDNQ